jgi:hypothetical protein
MTDWTVTLSLPTEADPFASHDCKVIDVGHSDKGLTVECPEVAARIQALKLSLKDAKAALASTSLGVDRCDGKQCWCPSPTWVKAHGGQHQEHCQSLRNTLATIDGLGDKV